MIATSVEIVPSRSMTICLAWKALLSSASFQLIAPWRYKAFLIGGGRVSHRLDRRLFDLRIVSMQLAVLGNDVFPAIGNQEVIERSNRCRSCSIESPSRRHGACLGRAPSFAPL